MKTIKAVLILAVLTLASGEAPARPARLQEGPPAAESLPSGPAGTAEPALDSRIDDRLAQLLSESDLNAVRIGRGLWGVRYRGRNRSDITVLMSTYGDLVVTQTMVREGPVSAGMPFETLLKLNFEANLAKIGLGSEGDLIVLNETEAKLLDPDGLARIVEQVARLADEIVGIGFGVVGPEGDTGPDDAHEAGVIDLLEGGAVLSYDPEEWRVDGEGTGPGRHALSHAGGEVQLLVVDERIQVPVEIVPDAMLDNILEAAPDARIVSSRSRVMAGERLQVLDIEATISGIPVSYYAYAYTGPAGTVQFIALTSRDLIAEYRAVVDRLVAGFRIRPG